MITHTPIKSSAIPSIKLSSKLQAVATALEQKRFFKLICGASLTDDISVQQLVALYASAGVNAIDIAPDRGVLEAVRLGLNEEESQSRTSGFSQPLIMVSLPLDPDPHFRKIDLDVDACIQCNLCVPVCPTDAIQPATPHPDPLQQIELSITQPLCYGCGRCPAVCPTDALTLRPNLPDTETLNQILTDPLVEAVEIHTHYADPDMLTAFLDDWGTLLSGKLISLCFRPSSLTQERCLQFLQSLKAFTDSYSPLPLVLQIDGASMTGSDHDESYQPALENARKLYQWLKEAELLDDYPWLTLSGGINDHTALAMNTPDYHWLAGVGMGTFARRWLWGNVSHTGLPRTPNYRLLTHQARQLVQPFQHRKQPSISLETNVQTP